MSRPIISDDVEKVAEEILKTDIGYTGPQDQFLVELKVLDYHLYILFYLMLC